MKIQQIIPILAIWIIFIGCAPHHRNFARVNLNGTFRVSSISTTSTPMLPYTRVIPEGGMGVGESVVVTQTESQIIFAHATKRKVLDLSRPSVYMRGNSLFYEPSGAGVPFGKIFGPSSTRQYDRINIKDSQLTVTSENFEAGLFLFIIPWKEGGESTTVKLQRMDSNQRIELAN